MRHIWIAATALAAALGAGTASAAPIFETGFEAPDYALGALGGQNGWGTFGTAAAITVQDAVAASGTQAAAINGGLVLGQSGPFHNNPSGIARITLSADILLTEADIERAWQFSAIGPGLLGFSGGVDIDTNGTIRAITSGFTPIGSFSRGVFHNVAIDLNYTTQRYNVRLDGGLLASNLAFCGDNGACGGAHLAGYNSLIFDTFGVGGTDTGYLDNVRVAATAPEPAAWGLMILGFAGLGAAMRRRRVSATA